MPGVRKMGRDGREDAIALDDELFRVLPDGEDEDEDLDLDAPRRGRGRRARADQRTDDGEGLRAGRRDGRRGSGRGVWLPLGVLLGIAVLGWGAWMSFAPAPEPTPATGDMMAVVAPSGGTGLNDLPLIEADPTPYKQEPGDPGGLQVENTDKQVYERVRDSAQVDDGAAVEQLLPGPVRPVAPPEPEPAPPPAPAPVTSPAPTPAVPDGPEPDGAATDAAPATPAVPGIAPPAVPQTTTPEAETPAPPPASDAPASDPAVASEPTAPAAPATPEAPTAPAPTAPAAPAAPAPAAPAPAESVTAAVESGPQVQLAAFRQRALAQAHWETLLAAHPDLLGSVPHVIVFADLGDRGQFYRLRAGPFGAAEQAQALCGALKQRDVECLVVRE